MPIPQRRHIRNDFPETKLRLLQLDDDDNANDEHTLPRSQLLLSGSSSKDRPSAINYREMLPKLDEKGLRKWRSLAEQLRLPFHLVKLAVKSRLGGMVELLDTDDLG